MTRTSKIVALRRAMVGIVTAMFVMAAGQLNADGTQAAFTPYEVVHADPASLPPVAAPARTFRSLVFAPK